jgi:plastocyanin
MAEDAKDAVEDGIIVIAAASNDNLMAVPEIDPTTGATHQDWGNYVYLSTIGVSRYYNRGSAPSTGEGVICVGSISTDQDFRRSSFSNYGSLVDVWAPGSSIVSCYNQTGTPDTKYGGNNWFRAISGTSMATPQVSGMAANLASNFWRYTNKDILGLIQQNSKLNDLTIDLPRSADGQAERIVAVEAPTGGGSGHYVVYGFTIDGYHYTPGPNTAQNTTIRCWLGDKVTFYLGYNGQFSSGNAITNHPFYIKTANTTGTGDLVSTGTITGTQGATSGTLSWDTTGVTPGTYYYQCSAHLSMYGKIEVLAEPGPVAAAGSFISNTCFKGGFNRYVLGTNVRPTTGVIDGWYGQTLKGDRNTGKPYANRQIFPRQNSYHRGQPGPLTYTLAVTDSGGNYVMTGHDRNSAYTAKTNPTLVVKKGDIIKFEMNASGHPLWISTTQGIGQPSASSIPANITNNGTATGATITWDTSASPTGTTYYNCEYHASMTGMIFVNA